MYEKQMGITQRVVYVRETNGNNANSSVFTRSKWEQRK